MERVDLSHHVTTAAGSGARSERRARRENLFGFWGMMGRASSKRYGSETARRSSLIKPTGLILRFIEYYTMFSLVMIRIRPV